MSSLNNGQHSLLSVQLCVPTMTRGIIRTPIPVYKYVEKQGIITILYAFTYVHQCIQGCSPVAKAA